MKADPDYLEFLKLIAKPAEHLPSAEIQLERKEAEQSGLLLCSLTNLLTLLAFVKSYVESSILIIMLCCSQSFVTQICL